jgi:hypothetical protein
MTDLKYLRLTPPINRLTIDEECHNIDKLSLVVRELFPDVVIDVVYEGYPNRGNLRASTRRARIPGINLRDGRLQSANTTRVAEEIARGLAYLTHKVVAQEEFSIHDIGPVFADVFGRDVYQNDVVESIRWTTTTPAGEEFGFELAKSIIQRVIANNGAAKVAYEAYNAYIHHVVRHTAKTLGISPCTTS